MKILTQLISQISNPIVSYCNFFKRVTFNFSFLVPPIVDIIPKKEINLDYAPSNSDKDKDNAGILPTEDTSVIMNPKPEDRPTSFFSQPGILAGKNCSLFYLFCLVNVYFYY